MKNLKLFVFALCAVLLSVVTVNAEDLANCRMPGTSGSKPECEAQVINKAGTTVPYEHAFEAWADVKANGGTFELLSTKKTYSFTGDQIDKNVTIVANDNTLTINGQTVKAGGSLTIKGGTVNVNTGYTVETNGSLTLSNVKATSNILLVNNNGTTNITGGEITANLSSSHLISNGKNATLTVNETKVTFSKGTVVYNFGTATLTGLTVDAKDSSLVNVGGHGSTTTIDGGSYLLNRVISSNIAAVPGFQESAAVVNVKNGTFESASTAFVVKYGMKLNVTGGTVTAGDRGIDMTDSYVAVSNGTIKSENATVATAGSGEGSLTISGGKFVSKNSYPLFLQNNKLTYAVSDGTFESEVEDYPAIQISNLGASVKDGVVSVAKAYQGILTGGKYLNNIISKVNIAGGNYDVTNILVAKDYTVKEEDNYKVVVSTKASTDTTKPGAPGKEEAPNTFDAGLVYMGLALSAIGASVVSVRKLRNN